MVGYEVAVDQLTRTFAALADPTRRAILGRLAEGEATVNELAEPFPISGQAVSKHLKVLERAGLITRGRTAQLRPSRLQAAPLKDAVDWLETYRRFWEGASTAWGCACKRPRRGPGMAEPPASGAAAEPGITITASSTRPASTCGRSGPSRSASRTGSAAARPRCPCPRS
jgi:DNA-binding transcriptional ArsR family regulator